MNRVLILGLVAGYISLIVVSFRKGKVGFGWIGVVGLFPLLTPFLGWFPLVGALTYAKPDSNWPD